MSRRIVSIIPCLAVAAAMALPVQVAARSLPERAGGLPLTMRHAAAVEDAAAILGLESDDAAAGEALTKALRKAFAKRGMSGSQEMSLLELRLTMGCESDTAKCLAEGGKAIEARRLVYGYLRKTGGSYQLKIYMLDVASASVDRDSTEPLSPADLSAGKIDATAARIVAGLMPQESDPEAIPETDPVVEPDPQIEPDKPKPDKQDKKYVWGPYQPVPTWKKVGAGVSGGLFVLGLASGIGLTISLNVTLRKELLAEVDASHEDDNPNNDIDRSEDDLCAAARATPPGEPNPNKVTNAKVTEVCNTADGVAKAAIAAWVGTGVFALATATFVTLLYVHKKKKPGNTAWDRRKPTFGMAPNGGGLTFGGGMRF